MKKYAAATLAALFYCAAAFSEIVAWKGMELGAAQNPKWLSNLVKKNDDALLRKKFGIAASETIFFGKGTGRDLQFARNAAYSDCLGKISAAQKDNAFVLNKLSFVYEYWEQDDEDLYAVWAVYSLPAK